MDLLSFLYEARQAKMPAEVQVNFADVVFLIVVATREEIAIRIVKLQSHKRRKQVRLI